eukprot:16416-Amphidinium_carterae.2
MKHGVMDSQQHVCLGIPSWSRQWPTAPVDGYGLSAIICGSFLRCWSSLDLARTQIENQG